MEINDFIADLEENFDNLDPGTLKPESNYHEIDEWSSMHALIVIALADTEYGVILTGEDFRSTETVEELFLLMKSRK